jgi:type I restriction enzyme R subunit
VEYDFFSGLTSAPRPIGDFPSPEELRSRYEEDMGFRLDDKAARPLLQPYSGGEGTRRYYQDAAIRAVMEKIAVCDASGVPKRALLSLATGAGKTRIAVDLLKRCSDAGTLTKALFVCDRDELRTQALAAFQNVFGSDAAEAFRKPDGTNNAKNARIHVATYQTLGVEGEDGDTSFLTEFYPADCFSHVVIDECHRSAWGKWSQVLTRNKNAAQVGLTATPRKLKAVERSEDAEADERISANNIAYFGEPVYEYDMAQAIEDGYLAACEIRKGRVDIDDTGITKAQIIARHPVDAVTGRPLTEGEIDELYERTQYEDRILLPDRVLAMCSDFFSYLLETGGPEQKSIVFCAHDRHADDVAVCMNNLYASWCGREGRERLEDYAFKCTAASSGNDQLPDLRASSRSHFIATTVDLLSTGVDVPCTRIDAPTNKLMFRDYDYTDASRLFGEDFITKPPRTGDGPEPEPPPPPPPSLSVEGFDVHITEAGRFIVADVDGRAMPIPLEEYKDRMAERLVREAASLEDFRRRWVDPNERRELLDSLVMSGYSPSMVRTVEDKLDYDLYDLLAELGWGMSPRTRGERANAFIYKHEEWINALPKSAGHTIRAIARQFERGGTEGLENPHVLQTPEVKASGGLEALRQAGDPKALLAETKTRMFAA